MGTAAVVLGAIGIVVEALVVKWGLLPFAIGIGAAMVALVLGMAARKSSAGKAGLALGVLGTVGAIGVVLLLLGRQATPNAVRGPVAVPAVIGTPPAIHAPAAIAPPASQATGGPSGSTSVRPGSSGKK